MFVWWCMCCVGRVRVCLVGLCCYEGEGDKCVCVCECEGRVVWVGLVVFVFGV